MEQKVRMELIPDVALNNPPTHPLYTHTEAVGITHALLGAVSPTTLTIWARGNKASSTFKVVATPVRCGTRYKQVVRTVSERGAGVIINEKSEDHPPCKTSPSFHSATVVTERLTVGSADSDYTGTVRLSDLVPSTEYEIVLTSRRGGYSDNNTMHTARTLWARTLPEAGSQERVTFTFGSCMMNEHKPFNIFNTILTSGQATREAHQSAPTTTTTTTTATTTTTTTTTPNDLPSFMLFMGDQIYFDYPTATVEDKGGRNRRPRDDAVIARSRGGFTGLRRENKREHDPAVFFAKFRANFEEPHLSRFFSFVPTFMMWDDHELVNNYYRGLDDQRYIAARRAFDAYESSHGPALRNRRGSSLARRKRRPTPEDVLSYCFAVGGKSGECGDGLVSSNGKARPALFKHGADHSPLAEFFVMDQRTFRSQHDVTDGPEKTILGSTQREALLSWLSSSSATFKVLVSAVQLSDFNQMGDAWHMYSHERNLIMTHINEHQVSGVVCLSADAHMTAVFRLPFIEAYTLHEFSVSPLGIGSDRTYHGQEHPDLVYHSDKGKAFGRVTMDPSPVGNEAFHFEAVSEDGSVLYQESVYAKDLRFPPREEAGENVDGNDDKLKKRSRVDWRGKLQQQRDHQAMIEFRGRASTTTIIALVCMSLVSLGVVARAVIRRGGSRRVRVI